MKKYFLAIAVVSALASPVMAASEETHHTVGVFLGASNIDDETDFSYGFEYEYKFNQTWGIGPVYEKTDDAHHGDGVEVKLISLYAHIQPAIRLGVGYGEEKVGGDHPHSEDLIRVSAAYDFHVGGFGIAPTIALDFVDGERAEVFGIAFSKSF
jgi:hypothetical protein